MCSAAGVCLSRYLKHDGSPFFKKPLSPGSPMNYILKRRSISDSQRDLQLYLRETGRLCSRVHGRRQFHEQSRAASSANYMHKRQAISGSQRDLQLYLRATGRLCSRVHGRRQFHEQSRAASSANYMHKRQAISGSQRDLQLYLRETGRLCSRVHGRRQFHEQSRAASSACKGGVVALATPTGKASNFFTRPYPRNMEARRQGERGRSPAEWYYIIKNLYDEIE